MALLPADRVEVSWDNLKSKWLVHIHVGEEVIRRHWKGPKDEDPRPAAGRDFAAWLNRRFLASNA
jgi:hypothetical protein